MTALQIGSQAPHTVLTRDNLPLSKPKIAIDCIVPAPDKQDLQLIAKTQKLDDLIEAAISPNTRRAYRTDMQHFKDWGGTVPTSPETLADYLAAHAGVLSVATLARRLVAIGKAHTMQGHPNPASSDLVKLTMRGVRRLHGRPQRQAAAAIKADILAMVAGLDMGMKSIRDRALILIGFAGAFRRSELVGLDFADIDHVSHGIVITLRKSKTDQEGLGRKIGIPFARGLVCPVLALKAWLEKANITDGPIFRPVDRHGHIIDTRLSGEAVAVIVKERAKAAGLDPSKYSGHSLRAGLATSAATAGVASWKIRQQTGHASDAMLNRYIRDGELFRDNAAGAIF